MRGIDFWNLVTQHALLWPVWHHHAYTWWVGYSVHHHGVAVWVDWMPRRGS